MSDLSVKEMVFNHEKAFRADKAVGVEAVIQYHLTGEEGGDYVITIKDAACSVQEGTTDAPTMTMTADGRYFGDVLLGKEDGMKGFMQGKLKLAGDLNLAMKLTTFFKMS
jgi:putative sterol carrier protein